VITTPEANAGAVGIDFILEDIVSAEFTPNPFLGGSVFNKSSG